MRFPVPTLPITIFVLLACAPALASGQLVGQVVSVHDGDTLTLLVNSQPVRVRLAEVDAPELRQSFGAQARDSLLELCLQKPASARQVSKGAGVVIGRVECEGVSANEAQVERGMAWVARRDSRTTSPLHFLEDQAQRSRTGLWGEKSPVAPWIWRKVRR